MAGQLAQLTNRTRRPNITRSQIICYNCNKPGHISRDCHLRNQNRRDHFRSNKQRREYPKVKATEEGPKIKLMGGARRIAGCSSNVRTKSHDTHELVVNSGASEHVVCDPRLLTHVVNVQKVSVELPNGARIQSEKKGMLSFMMGETLV